jgi:hypothetical protein
MTRILLLGLLSDHPDPVRRSFVYTMSVQTPRRPSMHPEGFHGLDEVNVVIAVELRSLI